MVMKVKQSYDEKKHMDFGAEFYMIIDSDKTG